MTKTALRALIVTALSAAVLATTAPAIAQAADCDPGAGQMSGCPVIPCPDQTDLVYNGAGEPNCKPWSEDKGDPESGPAPVLDPDPSWDENTQVTVCMTQPQLCQPQTRVSTAPTAAVPTPAAKIAPKVPGSLQEPLADGFVAGTTDAPALGTAALPNWVLMDKIMEFFRTLVPWAFPPVS